MNRRKFSELRAQTVRTPEAAAKVEAYKAAMRDVLAIEELRDGATARRHDGTTARRHDGTTARRHDGTTARDR